MAAEGGRPSVHPFLPAPSCVPGTAKVLLPFPLGALGLSLPFATALAASSSWPRGSEVLSLAGRSVALEDANPWWTPLGCFWWDRGQGRGPAVAPQGGARRAQDCWRHHHTIGSLSTATSKTLIIWALRNVHPRESAQLHPDDSWQ